MPLVGPPIGPGSSGFRARIGVGFGHTSILPHRSDRTSPPGRDRPAAHDGAGPVLGCGIMADVNSVAPDTAGPDSSTIPPAAAAPEPAPEPVTLTDELIELARTAATEEAGADGVGEYLGAWSEDTVATSARFAATDRGYRGWYWLVTVAVVEIARPTISEVVLLPGDGALLAPAWIPWDQRVRPGDLGVGDLLPPPPDDDRLVPGYLDSDDPAVREVEYEFGFGRPRVLGREGRDDAAQRWHDGPFGPSDPMAKQAPAACGTCGFYVRLEGLLGQSFGACSNEFSPADGRVVDVAYGCGAHSETVVDAPLISASTATVMDEVTLEVHRRPAPAADRGPGPAADSLLDPAAGDAPAGTADAEPAESAGPTDSAEPTESALVTDDAEPVESAEPTESAEVTDAVESTESAEDAAEPVGSVGPSESAQLTDAPVSVADGVTDEDGTAPEDGDAAGSPPAPDAGAGADPAPQP